MIDVEYRTILGNLLRSLPGARGVVFCDDEGEMVSCAGASGRHAPDCTDDWDLRIAGARLADVLESLRKRASETLGTARELVVRAPHETLVVRPMSDGYYLLLCLAPGASSGRALHALREAAGRIESL